DSDSSVRRAVVYTMGELAKNGVYIPRSGRTHLTCSISRSGWSDWECDSPAHPAVGRFGLVCSPGSADFDINGNVISQLIRQLDDSDSEIYAATINSLTTLITIGWSYSPSARLPKFAPLQLRFFPSGYLLVSHIHDNAAPIQLVSVLGRLIHDRDHRVVEPATSIFIYLANTGLISELIVPVIQETVLALTSRDPSERNRGAYISLELLKH
ncbi:945_t:CDS:2, partial [Acaulospora colombiana]